MSEDATSHSAETLVPLVYSELRRLAAYHMAHERPGQTIQATALVHEAWLRLSREEKGDWENSRRFIGAAATAMRRILIENARRKKSPKHGGHLNRVDLEDASPASRMPSEELLALGEALELLAEEDPEAAQLVELRFFVGMGHQEAAQVMDLSRRQADGLWAFAKAWLRKAIKKDLGATGSPFSP